MLLTIWEIASSGLYQLWGMVEGTGEDLSACILIKLSTGGGSNLRETVYWNSNVVNHSCEFSLIRVP
jgi:hypothetical protein